jgi:uncharacterized protein
MKNSRTIALGFVAVAVALLGLFGFAGPAAAHVTVHSPGATQGGYAVLTFQVPTESATASTVKLQVQFPTEAPIASVSVQPHPGWTFQTVTSKLATPVQTEDGDTLTEAVSEIDWTADSADTAIKPGEFDQFLVSAGPLPKVTQLQFSAIQTYSDGTIVRWNETAAPGSSVRPDHPKPTLLLAAAGSGDAAATTGSGSSSDTAPVILSIIALVIAVAALGLAVVTRARQPRQVGG